MFRFHGVLLFLPSAPLWGVERLKKHCSGYAETAPLALKTPGIFNALGEFSHRENKKAGRGTWLFRFRRFSKVMGLRAGARLALWADLSPEKMSQGKSLYFDKFLL